MVVKQNAELKELVDQLVHIKTGKSFRRWKKNFLNKWEEFLLENDIQNANKAYKEFSKSMEKSVKMIHEVNDYVDNGDLTVQRATVKARNALNETMKVLTSTIRELDDLIPQKGYLEKKRGYNKFHIGAVLVRDNFGEYGRLCDCRDILQHMRQVSLGEVADKQQLVEMDNFKINLEKFCDVMADLGLFEVMLKCREFADDDQGPNLENLIFIDMKTLGLGELSRHVCLQNNVLTPKGIDANGHGVFAENAADDVAKDKLLKIITEHPTLGFSSGKSNSQYDQEKVAISEMEKVQNMWGVKLKKTPKNVKGQELIYVDQFTGAYGELSRQTCLDKGVLTEIPNDDENSKNSGKLILKEAEQEFGERTDLIERVRVLLKLGIEKK